jgi:hypothetical protein
MPRKQLKMKKPPTITISFNVMSALLGIERKDANMSNNAPKKESIRYNATDHFLVK